MACGGGVYVRTLIEDVAEAVGTLAHVSALRRLGVAPFEESGMVTMDRVEAVAAGGYSGLDALLLPADAAVPALPAVMLSASESFYLQRGNTVAAARRTRPGPVRLYADAQGFIGIGEATVDGQGGSAPPPEAPGGTSPRERIGRLWRAYRSTIRRLNKG